MAIFCLADGLADLERRLGDIVIAYTRDRKPIYARDVKAPGPMTVLLKDALMPNFVQTLKNNPAFINGGPFANIAHVLNMVPPTTPALQLSAYVVTEAGLGSELAAETVFSIQCPTTRHNPKPPAIIHRRHP